MELYGDKHMLETVFRNLISNAIKFSYQDSKIWVKAIEKNGITQINIIDNGVGIAEENILKIFKKNEFITTPGTNREKGSGIGLILCREFIEQHKGKSGQPVIMMEKAQQTISFTIPVGEQNN